VRGRRGKRGGERYGNLNHTSLSETTVKKGEAEGREEKKKRGRVFPYFLPSFP